MNLFTDAYAAPYSEMRVQFVIAAVALLLGLVAAVEQDKWAGVSVASGPKNDIARTIMQPGRPIVVHPFVEPVEKVYNKTKTTPGVLCETSSDCEACIGKHYCLWTEDSKCVNSAKSSSRALVFQGKASNVCVSKDAILKRTIVKQQLHRLSRATEVQPLPPLIKALRNPEAVPPLNYGGVPLYVNKAIKLDIPVAAKPVFPPGFAAEHLLAKDAKTFSSNTTAQVKIAAPQGSKNVQFVESAAEVEQAAEHIL